MSKINDLQLSSMGGKTNLLAKDYKISLFPEEGLEKLGVLAHVDKKTRDTILNAGEGELERHADHINKFLTGNGKRPYKKHRPRKVQHTLDL